MNKIWDFHSKNPHIPNPEEIQSGQKWVNYRKVKLFPAEQAIFLTDPHTQIGLGGIAKGYIIDRVFNLFKKKGYTNILVNIGGDLRVCGHGVGGHGWKIGIQNPMNPKENLFYIRTKNGAVATSGDYKRFFKDKKGHRFHHILDPKTGKPSTKCRSVTVIAPEATVADGLATALFVMGPEEGIPFVEQLKNIGAIWIDSKGKIYFSKKLKSKIIQSDTIKTNND